MLAFLFYVEREKIKSRISQDQQKAETRAKIKILNDRRDKVITIKDIYVQFRDQDKVDTSSQVRSNNLTSFTYGHRGSLLIRSIQHRLGVPVDGFLGPQTIKALQRHYGTYVDGRISKNSPIVRAMERSLNQNRF